MVCRFLADEQRRRTLIELNSLPKLPFPHKKEKQKEEGGRNLKISSSPSFCFSFSQFLFCTFLSGFFLFLHALIQLDKNCCLHQVHCCGLFFPQGESREQNYISAESLFLHREPKFVTVCELLKLYFLCMRGPRVLDVHWFLLVRQLSCWVRG